MIVDQNKTLPWRQTIEGLKDHRVSLRRRNLPHVYRYCIFFILYLISFGTMKLILLCGNYHFYTRSKTSSLLKPQIHYTISFPNISLIFLYRTCN